MKSTSYFLEHRETGEFRRGRDGLISRNRTEERGLSLCRSEGSSLLHRWRALPAGVRAGELPEAMWRAAEPLLSAPALEAGDPLPFEELDARLAVLAKAHGNAQAELKLREVCQQVLHADDRGLSTDERRHVLVEMRAWVERDGKSASIQRERAFSSRQELLAALPSIIEGLGSMWALAEQRLSATPAPSGPTVVVLPPGADAGVLFHEVCGHPLEGDVVSQRASYLAERLAQQVAADFVTVRDNPCHGSGALSYGVDDESAPARAVPLIAGGVVTEPLLDRQAAATLGREPNGHGRRVSFRHPPLPRMSHTELAPHQGTLDEIVAGVPRGLLVRYLTPRHVDLLSGDFSFYVVEAQEIVDGAVGGFIGPAILRGNGLQALRGIDAVGADLAPFFGLKGCGKLDHGPLPVSFGNPTVRIHGLSVSPWI